MLRIRTASSNNADAALAGKECARKVKDALHDLKLVFVYSGVSYDQQALLKAIGEELPGVPLIGNTSFSGVVTQDGFITGEKGFVGIMALKSTAFRRQRGGQYARRRMEAVCRQNDNRRRCSPCFFLYESRLCKQIYRRLQ